MASTGGNPNQPAATHFDIQKLFKPPNSSPNPNGPPPFPPPSHYHAPPPPGAFSYPPSTQQFHHHPFLHYPQDPRPSVSPYPVSPPYLPNPNPCPNPNPNPNPNHGARLMALLGTAAPSNLESASSMPLQSSTPPSSTPSSASSLPEYPLLATPPIFHALPSAPPASLLAGAQQVQGRMPSSKLPRGRRLPGGDRVIYDVDVKLPGELQPPQLEVTPITKYLSDPGLVLGRQIAVNRTYICYGLKQGTIRVININTALRSLLRGHTQRVTDMAFFAEDVPLLSSVSVEGRVFVWKINEGPGEENEPQITGKVVIAIHIVVDGESYHPRICWHPHKQEVLIVGIGNSVLKIDTTKVGKYEEPEEPLRCSVDKLIDGVQVIGKHDGEVTDLCMSQGMTNRLVSASKDGTVKIWEDRKAMPLVILRPHDGQPVNSVAFLTSPQQPDRIILITAGPLNREVKIWTSASEEGLLSLPGGSESWQCTQTLDLRSSAEPRVEEAFFNQVVVLPRASLILLANAKKNTIYAVHIDYAPYPASTRMDYIADFTVTMPILSLTGTSNCLSDGEHVVQVYCVQTQAIQQYALEVSQCLPPPIDNAEEKDPCISHAFETPNSRGFSALDPSRAPTISDFPTGSPSPKNLIPISSSEGVPSAIHEFTTSNMDAKPSAPPLPSTEADIAHLASCSVPFNLDLPGRPAGLGSSPRDFEQGDSLGDRDVDRQAFDYSSVVANMPTVPSVDDKSRKEELTGGINDISKMTNCNILFRPCGNTTHLITPSEILSGATSSSETTLDTQDLEGEEVELQNVFVNNDATSAEVEVKVVGESGSTHPEFNSQNEPQVSTENMENSFCSRTSTPNIEMEKECSAFEREAYSPEKTFPVDNIDVAKTLYDPPNVGEEVQDSRKDMPEKATESATSTIISQPFDLKGKKQKPEQFQGSAASSPSSSHLNSIDSSSEPENSFHSADAAFSQLLTMQEMLNQLMTLQKEMQREMSVMVVAPITKEGKRVEAALGRSMEKSIKANMDAMWARVQEENAKQENLKRDHIQQITSLVTNYANKDLPALLERAIKKEISAVGPVLSRAVNPVIEKSISSAIVDSFQRGVGDKAVNQLEKSVNSKLEATVARQIQTQFQTSGKQALQDGLRSSFESSAIPAFEKACKVMFEQVNVAFQKGMTEHTTASLQQVESAHTPLALTLRDAINSASSITQNLASELADGQRKLLALVTAGNTKALNPMANQQSNGPLGLLSEKLEEPLDPRKELTRLISEHKFEEAFTSALQRSDVSIVSWLCSQVDLNGICTVVPLPLSQGVLLSLLQQLACDIGNETSRKVVWMRDVAVVVNPTDPMITPHVRPIFEQVYSRLLHQRSIPTTTASEATAIHVTMHVINSLLMSCK